MSSRIEHPRRILVPLGTQTHSRATLWEITADNKPRCTKRTCLEIARSQPKSKGQAIRIQTSSGTRQKTIRQCNLLQYNLKSKKGLETMPLSRLKCSQRKNSLARGLVRAIDVTKSGQAIFSHQEDKTIPQEGRKLECLTQVLKSFSAVNRRISANQTL